MLAPGAQDAPVYAKEGSKVAASQGRKGENSYYYSVGKNSGEEAAALKPDLRGTSAAPSAPKEDTLASYSLSDESGVVKARLVRVGVRVGVRVRVRVRVRDESGVVKARRRHPRHPRPTSCRGHALLTRVRACLAAACAP